MLKLRLLLCLLSGSLFACAQPEASYVPTQVMLHVTGEQLLIDQLTQLRVSVRLRDSSGWRDEALTKTFAREALFWPLDFPILPRVPADALKQFEVVLDAIGASGVLAQARTISSFLPNERRVLNVPLFVCPNHAPGFICAEPDCEVDSCSVCSADGSCAPVLRVDPRTIETFAPGKVDEGTQAGAPNAGESSSGFDAGDGENVPPVVVASGVDSGIEAGRATTTNPVLMDAGTVSSVGDSGTTPVADVCAPNPCMNGATCARTGTLCTCRPGYSGTYCEINGCNPNPCMNGGTCTLGAAGVSCACPIGYEGARCAAQVTSCSANNVCTSADYPCTATPPSGYTCRGQQADWHMPDALPGSKYAPSYDTTTAGVVKDNLTGLIWQRTPPTLLAGCTGTSVVTSSNPTPQRGDTCSQAEAKAYCDGLTLAGSSDWRLPTKIELESIFDETRADPAIDTSAFPGTFSDTYWSSSAFFGSKDAAWLIDFALGWPGINTNTLTYRARCVR
jgi:hypothetical protein